MSRERERERETKKEKECERDAGQGGGCAAAILGAGKRVRGRMLGHVDIIVLSNVAYT